MRVNFHRALRLQYGEVQQDQQNQQGPAQFRYGLAARKKHCDGWTRRTASGFTHFEAFRSRGTLPPAVSVPVPTMFRCCSLLNWSGYKFSNS